MNTLYINISGDDIKSTENITVVGKPEDAIINKFYFELVKGIVKGVTVPRIGEVKKRNLVMDFDDPIYKEAFAKITEQWDLVKQALLGADPTGERTITLPDEYVEWLGYHNNRVYNEIAKSLAARGNDVVINIGNIYRNGLRLLVNNIDTTREYGQFVVSDALVDDESAIAKDVRKRIGEDVPFVPFGEWKESVEQHNKEKEEDEAFNNCTTIEACDSYLQAYPRGRYVLEVLARRAKLQKPSSLTISAHGVSFVMKPVEGGSFLMGSTDSEAYSNESPVHRVTIDSYYMGETEVTQALWKAVMGNNPSYFNKGDWYPVECVTWYDAVFFCNKLSEATNRSNVYTITGIKRGNENQITSANVTADFSKNGFRLPTEAEWEYAARGGRLSEGHKYSGSDDIDEVAWYCDNSNSETHPVKGKKANELELYDMSGNVWEWCNDWYGDYSSGTQTNPRGPSSGSSRVLRGGSWDSGARICRVSIRIIIDPDFRSYINGFRLCLP